MKTSEHSVYGQSKITNFTFIFAQAVRKQKAHQTTPIAMLASRLLNPPKLRGLEQGVVNCRVDTRVLSILDLLDHE